MAGMFIVVMVMLIKVFALMIMPLVIVVMAVMVFSLFAMGIALPASYRSRAPREGGKYQYRDFQIFSIHGVY